jgi:hypothetical protein
MIERAFQNLRDLFLKGRKTVSNYLAEAARRLGVDSSAAANILANARATAGWKTPVR